MYITSDKKLYYIDANNGQKIKDYDISFKNINPILYMDGYIFMTDKYGKIYNIDEANGTIKWQYEGVGKNSTPPFMFNGILYYGTSEGVIYAVGRSEEIYTYSPLIQKTEDELRDKKGFKQFRNQYNVSSGIVPKGIMKRTYNLGQSVSSSLAFENDFYT